MSPAAPCLAYTAQKPTSTTVADKNGRNQWRIYATIYLVVREGVTEYGVPVGGTRPRYVEKK
jgi:hypothetical protein